MTEDFSDDVQVDSRIDHMCIESMTQVVKVPDREGGDHGDR